MHILDPLYGTFTLPNDIERFLFTPEMQRLREIRLSNVDSINLLGISSVSRYEHSIGTAYLALLSARQLNLSKKDTYVLVISALFHDIASPPFGHTTELLFRRYHKDYSHEKNSRIIVEGITDGEHAKFGRFHQIFVGREIEAHKLIKKIKVMGQRIDPSEIADTMVGRGPWGKMINNKIDLDNIDNVYRLAYHAGLTRSFQIPIRLAEGFRLCDNKLGFAEDCAENLNNWLVTRRVLYQRLMYNESDFILKAMLTYALDEAFKNEKIKNEDWCLTDNELINLLYEFPQTKQIVSRIRGGKLYNLLWLGTITNEKDINTILDEKSRKQLTDELISRFDNDVILYWILDEEKISRKLDTPLFPISPFYSSHSFDRLVIGENSKSLLLGVLTESTNTSKSSFIKNAITQWFPSAITPRSNGMSHLKSTKRFH